MSKRKVYAVIDNLKLTKRIFGAGIVDFFLGPVEVAYINLETHDLYFRNGGNVEYITLKANSDAVEKIIEWLKTGKVPKERSDGE